MRRKWPLSRIHRCIHQVIPTKLGIKVTGFKHAWTDRHFLSEQHTLPAGDSELLHRCASIAAKIAADSTVTHSKFATDKSSLNQSLQARLPRLGAMSPPPFIEHVPGHATADDLLRIPQIIHQTYIMGHAQRLQEALKPGSPFRKEWWNSCKVRVRSRCSLKSLILSIHLLKMSSLYRGALKTVTAPSYTWPENCGIQYVECNDIFYSA